MIPQVCLIISSPLTHTVGSCSHHLKTNEDAATPAVDAIDAIAIAEAEAAAASAPAVDSLGGGLFGRLSTLVMGATGAEYV